MNIEDAKLEVYQMAICGASSEGVSEKLIAAGLDQLQVLEVFDDTIARLRKLATVDLDVEKGRAIARLDMLFLNCVKAGDMATALKTQRELSDLLNLKKAPKTSGGPLLQPAKLERINNG